MNRNMLVTKVFTDTTKILLFSSILIVPQFKKCYFKDKHKLEYPVCKLEEEN